MFFFASNYFFGIFISFWCADVKNYFLKNKKYYFYIFMRKNTLKNNRYYISK